VVQIIAMTNQIAAPPRVANHANVRSGSPERTGGGSGGIKSSPSESSDANPRWESSKISESPRDSPAGARHELAPVRGGVSCCSSTSLLEDGELEGEASEGCGSRSEEHTSELQSRFDLVCRLL